MHVLESGSGDPIILVHGLSGNYTRWGVVGERLSARHRVINYDIRGHGLTEKGPGLDCGFDAHVEDLAGLMEHAGIERAVVVGQSLGGMIVQHFALAYPEKVSKLVLVVTTACVMRGRVKPRFMRTATKILPYVPGILSKSVRKKSAHLPDELFPERAQPELDFHPACVGRCIQAIVGMDIRERVRGLEMPVLVVASKQDALVDPAQERELAELIPGAKLVEIDSPSHFVSLQRPDELTAAISAFIEN